MKYKFLRISLLSALTVLFGGTALGAAGEDTKLIDFPNSEDGITIVEGGTASYSTVKIHVNKDAVDCIKFANSGTNNGVTLAVEGGFKAGDVIEIAGAVSLKAEDEGTKRACVEIYTETNGTQTKTFTTKDFINGQLSADDPVVEMFTLESDCENLVLARSGGTGANVTFLTVTRASSGSEEGGNEGGDTDSAWTLETTLDFTTATYPEDPTIVLESSKCGTAYDTGNKKQQDIFKAIEPAELGGRLAFQAVSNGSGKGWWLRASAGGLYSYSAGRSAAVLDLTTGDRVVFNCTQSASTVMSLINGANEPDGPFVYELSEDGKSYICTMVGDGNIGFFGNNGKGYISSIEIYKPNGEVVLADYTVKYVSEEGNELKEPTVYQGLAGTVPAIYEADKARITVDDVTYIYASDDAADQTINEDGSTIVTIVFKIPEPVSYKVNEVAGGQIVRTTEGKDVEGTSIKVAYRSHNVLDGKLYRRGVTDKEYNHTFTLTTDGQVVNLDYTATDVNNVVYLAEGEDIEGLTLCTGADAANSAIRSSNSAAAYAAEDVEIVTLGAGVYTLHAVIFDSSKTPDSHWVFKAGEEEIADLHCTAINYEELASKEFTLTKETAIVMAKAGSNKMGLDLIYITGKGDVVTGISSVNAKAENGEVYNLQGQKVEKAQKGLYIVNGKKVVVK